MTSTQSRTGNLFSRSWQRGGKLSHGLTYRRSVLFRSNIYFERILRSSTRRPMLLLVPVILTGSRFFNEASRMDLEQTRISGSFDDLFFEGTSIDFGVQMTEVNNRSVESNIQLDNWGGITEPGAISDIIVRSSIEGQFDQLTGHWQS